MAANSSFFSLPEIDVQLVSDLESEALQEQESIGSDRAPVLNAVVVGGPLYVEHVRNTRSELNIVADCLTLKESADVIRRHRPHLIVVERSLVSARQQAQLERINRVTLSAIEDLPAAPDSAAGLSYAVLQREPSERVLKKAISVLIADPEPARRKDQLVIKSGNRLVILDKSEIEFVTRERDGSSLIRNAKEHLRTKYSTSELSQSLDKRFACLKRAIINMDALQEITFSADKSQTRLHFRSGNELLLTKADGELLKTALFDKDKKALRAG